MFTRDLEMCLMAAQSEAKDRRHEYLCVEHILYALLHNDNGVRIIRSCGGNVDRIKEDLEEFFDQQETMREEGSNPQQTRAVQRVLHLAIMHVNSSGKASADVGDILVAIHRESQSYASYFLQKEGITRLDLLNYISHGIAKVAVEDEEENHNFDSTDEEESSQGRGEQDALKNYTTNLTKHAEEAGADGALIVTPYYNKPTQEGLYAHYKAINDSCGIPIIIYNIPGRSVIDMTVDTMARLFELKNIVGVKDATGDLNRVDETFKKIGNEFIQLTGEDGLAFEYNKRGGVGCISVTANIAPKMCSDMQKFSKSSDKDELKKAEEIDQKLQPVHKSLFIESNPSPVKYAAKLIGLCDDKVRLPLVTVLDKTKSEVKKALISAELINE